MLSIFFACAVLGFVTVHTFHDRTAVIQKCPGVFIISAMLAGGERIGAAHLNLRSSYPPALDSSASQVVVILLASHKDSNLTLLFSV